MSVSTMERSIGVGQTPFVLSIPTFTDDRGVFLAVSNELPKELSLARVYGIQNFGKGVIRGFHKHRKEVKIFLISRGAAKFVTVRDGDESQRHSFILSDRQPQLLVIPPGWYNGWVSLEENTVLVGLSNATFEESRADDERVDPFAFGDLWKVTAR